MKTYPLPRCWLGQKMQTLDVKETLDTGELSFADEIVTESMINPACACENGMQAFWCSTGHMTECHAGMDCRQADCSHLERYE